MRQQVKQIGLLSGVWQLPHPGDDTEEACGWYESNGLRKTVGARATNRGQAAIVKLLQSV